jgi:hypothetical protein
VAVLSLLQTARLEKEVMERLKKDMQKEQQERIVHVLGFSFMYFFFSFVHPVFHLCAFFPFVCFFPICVLSFHLWTFFPFVYSFMFVYFFIFVHFFRSV